MRFEFSEIAIPVIPNKVEGQAFERLKAELSSKMFFQRVSVFDDQASNDGPWKPLSQVQAERRMEKEWNGKSKAKREQLVAKGYHAKILTDRGMLRQSFTPEAGAGSAFKHVEIGDDYVKNSTHIEYAAIHNFGGTILPKKGKYLVFPGSGGGMVFATKVEIPARPFDQFTDAQEEELAQITEAYLNGRR